MTALRYGDAVMIEWRGHELDRECGRVGTLANDPGVEVSNGDVVVTVRNRGAVTIAQNRLRPFGGIGWPADMPQVDELVAMAQAWPVFGISKFQLARILEVGLIPDRISVQLAQLGIECGGAGYLIDTAGEREGQRIRSWVTLAMFYRLHEIGRGGCR